MWLTRYFTVLELHAIGVQPGAWTVFCKCSEMFAYWNIKCEKLWTYSCSGRIWNRHFSENMVQANLLNVGEVLIDEGAWDAEVGWAEERFLFIEWKFNLGCNSDSFNCAQHSFLEGGLYSPKHIIAIEIIYHILIYWSYLGYMIVIGDRAGKDGVYLVMT